jgi:hypothetical protein
MSELVVAAAASPSTLLKQEEQEHDLMMDESEGNEHKLTDHKQQLNP